MREWINAGGNPVASYEVGYGVGNEKSGTTLKSFSFIFEFEKITIYIMRE